MCVEGDMVYEGSTYSKVCVHILRQTDVLTTIILRGFYHSQRITQSTDQGGERDAFILCKYFTKLEPNEEGGLS